MSMGRFKLPEFSSPFPREGGGVSTTLSFLMFKLDLIMTWDCFLHLHYESNFLINQGEASLMHIARRNAPCDSFTASRAGKTNLYTNLHVHVHWTWPNKISIPFTWHKVIQNSVNQNRIGRFPDFLFPFWQNKRLLARGVWLFNGIAQYKGLGVNFTPINA